MQPFDGTRQEANAARTCCGCQMIECGGGTLGDDGCEGGVTSSRGFAQGGDMWVLGAARIRAKHDETEYEAHGKEECLLEIRPKIQWVPSLPEEDKVAHGEADCKDIERDVDHVGQRLGSR